MSKLNELREQRSTLAKNLRNMLDQNPGKAWNADLQAKYDAGIDDIARIDAELDRNQKILDIAADKAIDEALKASAARGGKTVEDVVSERALYAQWARDPAQLTAEQWGAIRNTMSTTTGSQGGYTVQSEVANQLIDALKDYSAVRRVATVLQTAKGNPLSFPTTDGTAETGELIAENVTATAADPTFGTAAVNAYKFSSKIVAVPIELLQDAEVDIEAFVNRRLAERIGRSTNGYFTTGTGSSQPYGVITQASLGKTGTSGQTATVIADDLIDVVHALDVAYRSSGQCSWMMRDASFAIIRKLKDSQNRPIFIPGWDGLGRAAPDTLLGYPVFPNPDMAAMAANAYSIAFGRFDKYVVRDAMAVTVFRFTDSAYIKLGQVAFLAWHRSGGNLLDTAAVKTYRNSAT